MEGQKRKTRVRLQPLLFRATLINQTSFQPTQTDFPSACHRSSTPTPVPVPPPTTGTKDDLIYANFVRNLRQPFRGKVRGLIRPPSDLISGHLVLGSSKCSQRKESRCGSRLSSDIDDLRRTIDKLASRLLEIKRKVVKRSERKGCVVEDGGGFRFYRRNGAGKEVIGPPVVE